MGNQFYYLCLSCNCNQSINFMFIRLLIQDNLIILFVTLKCCQFVWFPKKPFVFLSPGKSMNIVTKQVDQKPLSYVSTGHVVYVKLCTIVRTVLINTDRQHMSLAITQ